MPNVIRSLTLDDRQSWERLFEAYADFYKVELPAEARSQTWTWIFNSSEDFWCDVIESEKGHLLGFVQYQLMHRSLSGEKVCYLSDLYVDSNLRGKRLGKALIDRVFDIAKQKQWSNVRWLTQQSNATARKLYDHYLEASEFILYSVPVQKDN